MISFQNWRDLKTNSNFGEQLKKLVKLADKYQPNNAGKVVTIPNTNIKKFD